MKSLLDSQLSDATAERVRRSHAEAIREIQDLPAASIRIVRGVVLANGVETEVAHGLGRLPLAVVPGAPKGAATPGLIALFGAVHSSGAPIDRTKVVVLQASGFGGTITVDVVFW